MNQTSRLVYFYSEGNRCVAAPLPGGNGIALKMKTCTIYCSDKTNFKVSNLRNRFETYRFVIEGAESMTASIDIADEREAKQLMQLMGIS